MQLSIGLLISLTFSASSDQEQEQVWKPFVPSKSARNNQCHNEWE